MRKTLIALVVLIVVAAVAFGYVQRANARETGDPTNGEAFELSVPVIVTPSVQVANGQVILYKMTNLSEGGTSFRLMLYGDDSGVPTFYKDFTRVGAGRTVSYVYRPPAAKLDLDSGSIEAPQAVRATVAPIPATGDPGVIRRVVANVQIMRVQDGPKGGSPTLTETPTIVPLTRCNFEPRSLIPYLGGHWYWNCAPDMYPVKPLPPQG